MLKQSVSQEMEKSSTSSYFSPTSLPSRAGLSLKTEHFRDILDSKPDIGFFEIHAENYLVAGGPFHYYLRQICEHYPLSIHGVGLSIGGVNPINTSHLMAIKSLLERYQPASFSEHLAWTSHGNTYFNDLLPFPYDDKALQRVCDHLDQIQSTFARRILLENPSTYIEFVESSYHEPEFIAEVARRTGCGLLLDVNNIYVSCTNHNWDMNTYVRNFPLHLVEEIHLAGFSQDLDSEGATLLIDSHGSQVDEAVWDLYQKIIEVVGAKPTLIEWDNNVPSFEKLKAEANKAELLLSPHKKFELGV